MTFNTTKCQKCTFHASFSRAIGGCTISKIDEDGYKKEEDEMQYIKEEKGIYSEWQRKGS